MVPGFEGIYQIKYLRRIKVVDRYYMTYDDTGTLIRPESGGADSHDRTEIRHHLPFRGQNYRAPGSTKSPVWHGPRGAIRSAEISTTRSELADCRTSDTGLSDGTYPIWLQLEMGRKRVHVDVALHGRTGHGAANPRRRREILERAGGKSPHSRRRQFSSTWKVLSDGSVQMAWPRFLLVTAVLGICQTGWTQSPTYGIGRTPMLKKSAPGYRNQPDGKGTPAGHGTAKEGAGLYVRKGCAACHGATGSSGGHAPTLVSMHDTQAKSLVPVSRHA